MRTTMILPALGLLLGACATSEAPDLATARIVDLSHAYDEDTVYWPTARGFELEVVHDGRTEGGYHYKAANLHLAEHCGTHMDAPIHFAAGRHAMHEVPLDQCIAPLAVVDVRARCAADRDYRLRVADLEAFEAAHGPIRPGDAVVMFTGWQERWPDVLRYLGDDTPGDASDLHFPGIGAGAARWLVERQVALVGLDTASLDHGPSQDFMAHRILNAADIPGLENLTDLDRLPPRGAWLVALPMKTRGGSGGPCRVAALLP